MKKLLVLLLLPLQLLAQHFTSADVQRCAKRAANVTIIRDNWGIPHIYGKTDADAVFGLLYAQCEDDFSRVEMNYIEKLGRVAEVKGESELYNDLLMRLIIDSADAKTDYNNSAPWMKKLLDAFADGINYYLYKHPNIHPALLTHFEPWYAYLWTDGSIGAINTSGITADDVKNFYTGITNKTSAAIVNTERLQTGSNGFAFSPSVTASGNAILYINPHVTFYFRPEVQMVSEEGLNAYGAVTWGQFFIYQGFNEHCGWMHTSSGVDVADLYTEKITRKDKALFYKYDNAQKPVIQKPVSLRYKAGNTLLTKNITTYYTGHGPVMTERNGQWISVKAENRIKNGLIQCWQRTKANSFADFKQVLNLHSNTSNNTVYADAEGNIAYWHGNFMPKRDTKLDWNQPVDGTTSVTEWKGFHAVSDLYQVINPANGWLQNCNSTPFTVAGANSPAKENYPAYMVPDGENYRGINAVRVLGSNNQYTLDKVIAAGYNTYLAGFEDLLPTLFAAWQKTALTNAAQYNALAQPIAVLQEWDKYATANSIATTLAVEWGEQLLPAIFKGVRDDEFPDEPLYFKRYTDTVSAATLMNALQQTVTSLSNRFGTWQVSWGTINRYQRNGAYPNEVFSDSLESMAVGRAASTWGSLPSFVSRYYPGTSKRYGFNGNSFICAVEFGKRIKAKSLLTGGESGDPSSSHFTDQANMYINGQLKEVLFYKEDVLQHVQKTYHPGE